MSKEENLQARIAKVETQIEQTLVQQHEVDAQLRTQDPDRLLKGYIQKLHEYNEIRDIGQGLMSILANQKGVRVVEVYKKFGVEDD